MFNETSYFMQTNGTEMMNDCKVFVEIAAALHETARVHAVIETEHVQQLVHAGLGGAQRDELANSLGRQRLVRIRYLRLGHVCASTEQRRVACEREESDAAAAHASGAHRELVGVVHEQIEHRNADGAVVLLQRHRDEPLKVRHMKLPMRRGVLVLRVLVTLLPRQ